MQNSRSSYQPRGPHKEWAGFVEKVRKELGWTLDQTCDLTDMKMGWLKKARRGQEIDGGFREKFENAINKRWKEKFPNKPLLVWPAWVDDAPWSETNNILPATQRSIVESKAFTVDWVLLAPFCPGENAKSINPPDGLVFKAADEVSRIFVPTADKRAELRWFDWGAAVWTLRTVKEFPNLATLATERRQLYRDMLKGQHLLTQLTMRINNAAKTGINEQTICQTNIGYALSMFSLIKSGWQREFIPHALQAMSCPNVILSLPEVEDCEPGIEDAASADEIREKECEILQHGIGTADLREFSQPGLVHGYACWAGVAAHVNEAMRPRMLNSCICFQQELQALWWRLHSLSASLNNRRPTEKEDEHMNRIRVAVQRTLRIGPTEVTALRLFKEAVIATSRFNSVYEEFQQTYRDSKNLQ
jgi:hypothetical protein